MLICGSQKYSSESRNLTMTRTIRGITELDGQAAKNAVSQEKRHALTNIDQPLGFHSSSIANPANQRLARRNGSNNVYKAHNVGLGIFEDMLRPDISLSSQRVCSFCQFITF
jgi:hypothetical protein